MTPSRTQRARRGGLGLVFLLCGFHIPWGRPALGAGVSDLEIGDAARRGHKVRVAVDTIVDTARGDVLALDELVARLSEVELLIVGENHTSFESHRIQRLLIEGLHDAGRQVLVGLEMYPATEQKYLDQWTRGLLTEQGFVELSDWYKNWGYHWGYYREIFLFARQHHLPMFAVNLGPDVVSAVRQNGFDGLDEDQSAQLPPVIDTESPDHRKLFRAFFEDDEEEEEGEDTGEEADDAHHDAGEEEADAGFHTALSDEQWDSLFRAQCTWDASMAYHAAEALKRHVEKNGNQETIMVVLAGLGHVAYGLGIERQATHYFDGESATLVPVTVRRKKKDQAVRASFADFLWGLPDEPYPTYPSLGVASRAVDDGGGLSLLYVEKGSAAEAGGMKLGDVLLTFDGTPLVRREALNELMAGKSWGESAHITLRRGEEEVALQVQFRRRRTQGKSADSE